MSLAIVTILVFTFFWLTKFSPSAQQAKINVNNSKQIILGMSTDELLNIMGTPTEIRIRKYQNEQDSLFFYMPPFAASSGIDIIIKNDTVKEINRFE